RNGRGPPGSVFIGFLWLWFFFLPDEEPFTPPLWGQCQDAPRRRSASAKFLNAELAALQSIFTRIAPCASAGGERDAQIFLTVMYFTEMKYEKPSSFFSWRAVAGPIDLQHPTPDRTRGE